MTDDKLELSRRKILASAGAIGLASAGAGLGTSAYFSDEETFTNNQLVAGELDLKVAVSQHYVDWLPDTDTTNGNVFVEPPQETDDARMPEGGETPDIRLGAGSDGADTKAEPIELALKQDEEDDPTDGELEDQYNDRPGLEFATGSLVNTINAGTASALGIPPGGYESSLCNIGAGGDDDDAERSIVQLEDVKPGDFGFIRFAFASCDNPAFVQVEGEVTDKDENGTTEPEAEDPDEEDGSVELLDEVRIALVDDDVANLIDGGYSDGDIEVDLAPGDGFAGSASTLRALDAEGGARERLDGDIDPEDGGGSSVAENNCFSAETNHYYSLVWWLPIDHANEIQSDSVTFELGIYAEQCRHNDGIGTAEQPECPPDDDRPETPICDWNDLNDIRNGNLEGFGLDGDYYLVRDLDKTSAGYETHVDSPAKGWDPIVDFTGTFDGDGHTIRDLVIRRPDENGVGLFGRTGGEIKNVGIEDATVKGNQNVGALVGRQLGGTVKRAYATGEVFGGSAYTGGLVGNNGEDATIKESYATADVTAGREGTDPRDGIDDTVTFGEYVGGLAGVIQGRLENSYATGDVTSNGNEYDDDGVGGLAGIAARNDAVVEKTYSTGDVDAEDIDKATGRLIGRNGATVRNSYADNGSTLVGPRDSTTPSGDTDDLVGDFDSAANNPQVNNIEGLDTQEMQGSTTSDNMSAFDFDNVWEEVAGPDDYPVLQALDRQTQLDVR